MRATNSTPAVDVAPVYSFSHTATWRRLESIHACYMSNTGISHRHGMCSWVAFLDTSGKSLDYYDPPLIAPELFRRLFTAAVLAAHRKFCEPR